MSDTPTSLQHLLNKWFLAFHEHASVTDVMGEVLSEYGIVFGEDARRAFQTAVEEFDMTSFTTGHEERFDALQHYISTQMVNVNQLRQQGETEEAIQGRVFHLTFNAAEDLKTIEDRLVEKHIQRIKLETEEIEQRSADLAAKIERLSMSVIDMLNDEE
uniref:Polyhydroxyalkanoate synthesis repressor PhaR n=1 Tax=Steinernema glaseri TaxID=37863 RepID=A0A1I8APU5_9BILA